jgi:hypothetical protein
MGMGDGRRPRWTAAFGVVGRWDGRAAFNGAGMGGYLCLIRRAAAGGGLEACGGTRRPRGGRRPASCGGLVASCWRRRAAAWRRGAGEGGRRPGGGLCRAGDGGVILRRYLGKINCSFSFEPVCSMVVRSRVF